MLQFELQFKPAAIMCERPTLSAVNSFCCRFFCAQLSFYKLRIAIISVKCEPESLICSLANKYTIMKSPEGRPLHLTHISSFCGLRPDYNKG